MAHALIGDSISLLPDNQDFQGAVGFEVRIPLFGTADRSFVINGDGMSATFRQGEAHRLAIAGSQQRGVIDQEFELRIGFRLDSFKGSSREERLQVDGLLFVFRVSPRSLTKFLTGAIKEGRFWAWRDRYVFNIPGQFIT